MRCAGAPGAAGCLLGSLAEGVRQNDGVEELLGDDVAREVVDGLAGDAGVLSDGADLVLGGHAELGEGGRQADLLAEGLDLVELVLRGTLEHELHERAEGDAAAVVGVVAAQGGQAVVEGVGRGAVDVVRADAGQVDVGLADGLERRGDHVVLAGLDGLGAVLAQGLVAELGERHAGPGDAGALKARGLGTDGGAALEVGAERVAHAGDQEAHGCVGDDVAVDQDGVRVGGVEEVLVEASVVVVDNREAGAGRVGRGDGRDDDDVLAGVIGGRLGGIDRAAATDGNDGVDVVIEDDLLHLLDLAVARDAAEDLVATVVVGVAEAGLDLVVAGLEAAVGADEQPTLAHVAHFLMELGRCIPALDVLQGLAHGTKTLVHNKSSW